MKILRYQNIYEIDVDLPKLKKRELLASINKVVELQQLLALSNINNEQEKLIQFDLEMILILSKYIPIIKEYKLPVSFNLYPVSLFYLIENKDKSEIQKYINILKSLANQLKWNFSIEIVENWFEDYCLQNNTKSKMYLDFLKSIWITVSIDDIVMSGITDLKNTNHHTLYRMISLFKKENIKYLKFDISFTNYLVNKPKILNLLFKMINNKYNNKVIILEWIETRSMVDIFEKYKNKYNKIKLYYQWFYFHKPETLSLDNKLSNNEDKQ